MLLLERLICEGDILFAAILIDSANGNVFASPDFEPFINESLSVNTYADNTSKSFDVFVLYKRSSTKFKAGSELSFAV
jgi:hypothetical protein